MEAPVGAQLRWPQRISADCEERGMVGEEKGGVASPFHRTVKFPPENHEQRTNPEIEH